MPSPASKDNPLGSKIPLIILVLSGAVCIFLCLCIIPKFEQIYQDVFPGRTLPAITNFVITKRVPLALLDAVWPVAAMILMWRRHRAGTIILNLGLLWCLLQIVITVYALFMPMMHVGIITGMSDAKP